MTADSNSNEWTQIRLRTDSKLSDTVSDLLEQMGALAVTFEDAADSPILEPRSQAHPQGAVRDPRRPRADGRHRA